MDYFVDTTQVLQTVVASLQLDQSTVSPLESLGINGRRDHREKLAAKDSSAKSADTIQKPLERLTVPLIEHTNNPHRVQYCYETVFRYGMSTSQSFINDVANRINTTPKVVTNKKEYIKLASVPHSSFRPNKHHDYYFEFAEPVTAPEKHNFLNNIIKSFGNSVPEFKKLKQDGVFAGLIELVCTHSLSFSEDEMEEQTANDGVELVTKSLLTLVYLLSKCDTHQFSSIVGATLIKRLVELLDTEWPKYNIATIQLIQEADLKALCIWMLDKTALCSKDMKDVAINLGAIHSLLQVLTSGPSSPQCINLVLCAAQVLVSFTADGTYAGYKHPSLSLTQQKSHGRRVIVATGHTQDCPRDACPEQKQEDAVDAADATLEGTDTSEAVLVTWMSVLKSACHKELVSSFATEITEQIVRHGSVAVQIVIQENLIEKILSVLESLPSIHSPDFHKVDNVLTILHVVLSYSDYHQLHYILEEYQLLGMFVNLLLNARSSPTAELTLSILHALVRDSHILQHLVHEVVVTALAKTGQNHSHLCGLLAHELLSQLVPLCEPDSELDLLVCQAQESIVIKRQEDFGVLHGLCCDVIMRDKPLEELLSSLKSLCGGLRGRIGAANCQFLMNGGLHVGLVAILRQPECDEVLLEGLTLWNCLTERCSEFQRQQLIFTCLRDILPVVLQSAEHESVQGIREQAKWALKRLIPVDRDTALLFRTSNGLGALIEVFEKPSDPTESVKQQAKRCMVCLVHNKVFTEITNVQQVKVTLQQLLSLMYNEHSGPCLCIELSTAFEQLASHRRPEISTQYFGLRPILPCFIRLLTFNNCPNTQCMVLRTLSHLLTNASGKQVELLHTHGVQDALSTLIQSTNIELTELANSLTEKLQSVSEAAVSDSSHDVENICGVMESSSASSGLVLPDPRDICAELEQIYDDTASESTHLPIIAHLNAILCNIMRCDLTVDCEAFHHTEGLLDKIVDQLETSVDPTGVLEIIHLLTRGTVQEVTRLAAHSKLISTLVKIFNTNQCFAATAALCLFNICAWEETDIVQSMINSNAVDSMMVTMNTTLCRFPKYFYAYHAILFLLRNADCLQILQLVKRNVISILVDLLSLDYLCVPEYHSLCLDALHTLGLLLSRHRSLDIICDAVQSLRGLYFVALLAINPIPDIQAAAAVIKITDIRERYEARMEAAAARTKTRKALLLKHLHQTNKKAVSAKRARKCRDKVQNLCSPRDDDIHDDVQPKKRTRQEAAVVATTSINAAVAVAVDMGVVLEDGEIPE